MEISKLERTILGLIVNELPMAEKSLLSEDISCASVCRRSADGRIVQFELQGYDRPHYQGQTPYSVEMSISNDLGSEVYVLLFMDRNSHLLELELIPVDESDVTELNLSAPVFHRGSGNSGDRT